MIAPDIVGLLEQSESSKLDFKRANYSFPTGTEVEKSELLKDILAIANADRDGDGHIVIGVAEESGRAAEIVGAEPTILDHEVQEFVNSKTNRAVRFAIHHLRHGGRTLTVVWIARHQARPLFLRKRYGRLEGNKVLVRRGSSTAEASPDEISLMGRIETALPVADLDIRFRIVVETWHYESFGGYPSNREDFDVELLEIVAVNTGNLLLQYIQGSVVAPRAVFLDYIDLSEIHASAAQTAASESLTLKFSSKLSDPASHAFAPARPAEWKPLSPDMELVVLREKVIPIGTNIREIPAQLVWEAAGDSCKLKRGVFQFRELDIIDRRSK